MLNRGIVFVVLGTVLFSSKAIVVKYLYQLGIGSLELQTLRMLFVFPFYAVILFWASRKIDATPISKKELLSCILAGIACYHIASYLDLLGLNYVSAGLERIILFCYPAIAILFSWFFLGEKPAAKLGLSLLLSYSGILVFFYADLSFGGDQIVWGSFLIFIASIFTAWYMVANQRFSRQIGSQRFVSLAMIAACISLIIHSASVGVTVADLTQYSTEHYVGIGVIAILMTLIPSFLISAGIKLIGASQAGIVGTIGPLFTIILSNQLLGEPISVLHMVGLVLVLLGMRQLKP